MLHLIYIYTLICHIYVHLHYFSATFLWGMSATLWWIDVQSLWSSSTHERCTRRILTNYKYLYEVVVQHPLTRLPQKILLWVCSIFQPNANITAESMEGIGEETNVLSWEGVSQHINPPCALFDRAWIHYRSCNATKAATTSALRILAPCEKITRP